MDAPSPVVWAAGAAALLASILLAAFHVPAWAVWTLAGLGLGTLAVLFARSRPLANRHRSLLLERVVSPGLPAGLGWDAAASRPQSDLDIVTAVTGRRPRDVGFQPVEPVTLTRTATVAVQARAIALPPEEPPVAARVTVSTARRGRPERMARRPSRPSHPSRSSHLPSATRASRATVDAEVDEALARREARLSVRQPRKGRPWRAAQRRQRAKATARTPHRKRVRTLRH